ncbi:MAG: nucleotide exchange factor GrpE [Patescibacteria group bacterium]|nr:nucleotide exchange factor GrpE [Patescibacteria group bacterium]
MEKLQTGIYQHYKGGKYELLFVAEQTETKEAMVIYRSLKDNKVWVRPLSNWQEKIEQEGAARDRFIKIEEIEEKDFEHQYKLALADYQNLLKQSVKDKADFAKYALNDFLQELLPVYDHLKMSLSALPDNEKDSAWVKGVEYVLKQFKDLLSNRGVEEIKTVGGNFDHNLMDAIEGKGNKVIKEIMPGYTLNSRVIRAAKVVVGD